MKIALVGNFPPTRCGIATFTSDLYTSLESSSKYTTVDVFVIKEYPRTQYPDDVRFEIDIARQDSYIEASDLVNAGSYDAVLIQHEYGIYGGIAGSFLLDFVWNVNVPIMTTLHTVLDKPSLTQKLVLEVLLDRSEKVIVMSEKAVQLLVEVHGVDSAKIVVVPHGIPEVPKVADQRFRLGIPVDSPMILTFGLLSPDKGIQTMIKAMPKILQHYPGAVYAVIGTTHPHVYASHGEEYRESLADLAEDLGVSASVKFINEFVPAEDLVGYLSAMDIYVTPYLKPNQITSGTLAYALGAGKAVVSTPYWYAEELLAEGAGTLVPFHDSMKLAEAVIEIEGDPSTRRDMGERAVRLASTMRWPQIGIRYRELIEETVKQCHSTDLKSRATKRSQKAELNLLPPLNLAHLHVMSDDTGILQHANHSTPLRSEGYCVDDNARALILSTLLEDIDGRSEDLNLAQSRYLSFVLEAFNQNTGRFRNFMSYQRQWLEDSGSEDSHGRSVWSLGTLIHKGKCANRRQVATKLFKDALPALEATTSPRTWAYGALGANEYLQSFPQDSKVKRFLETLSSRLLDQFETYRDQDWSWFEDSLTYANARLPQALILGGYTLINDRMLRAGLEALEWLRLIQINKDGLFVPVGSEGAYKKGGERHKYDQQPIEAAASVSAYLTAWKVTKKPQWLGEAHRAYSWFLGANTNGVSLYDPHSGACYDGLHPNRLNKNQGAESTLSFLCALTEMRTALFPSTDIQVKKTPYASK